MRAVLNGPQGQTVLESSVLTIGSSPYNSLVLDNIKVSAHHAEIRPEEQGYAITDLGSIHGTYVNGERLDFNALRRLNPGNSITIGDSTFTYEVEDVPQDLHDQANGAETLPADGIVVAGMPSENQQLIVPGLAYTSPQQYNPQQPYMQSVYPGTLPGFAGPPPGYVPIEQVRRRTRRLIWIGLGLVAVIALAVGGYLLFFTRPTPEKTLDTYCSALLGQDYLTAYNQLSSPLRNTETESQFASVVEEQGKLNSCIHGSASVNGSTASINLRLVASANQTNSVVTLVQDTGNNWKINLPFPPSVTLTAFCRALKNGDYQTAYDQLAGIVKSQLTEADFETTNMQQSAQVGGIASCSVSNVSEGGSSAIGTVTFLLGDGQKGDTHYSLANEGGFWKIDGAQ
jgi:FHA domain